MSGNTTLLNDTQELHIKAVVFYQLEGQESANFFPKHTFDANYKWRCHPPSKPALTVQKWSLQQQHLSTLLHNWHAFANGTLPNQTYVNANQSMQETIHPTPSWQGRIVKRLMNCTVKYTNIRMHNKRKK